MASAGEHQGGMDRLIAEDAVGQLRRRAGAMARLGSEQGALKLDWVEGVARLLAETAQLEQVEAEARAIWQRGIRHIIWAGMGGSVLTVRVLRALGFCGGAEDVGGTGSADGEGGEGVTIHPLDSTDPAALNAVLRAIAQAKGVALLRASEAARALLGDVLMIGVAMGMTSEEPITHLEWFAAVLREAGLPLAEHLLVMALPGSALDTFAAGEGIARLPLQPDGGSGTGGRMSAPSTRVFLLPAALYLRRYARPEGRLGAVLSEAWRVYHLDGAQADPARHPFARLAVALSEAAEDGACRLLVRVPEGWQSFIAWLEQLLEESLGKGGKGIVVFPEQPLNERGTLHRRAGMLRVAITTEQAAATEIDVKTEAQVEAGTFTIGLPMLAQADPSRRLAAFAASCMGWQLAMALYGYLQEIPFAGQPAVEHYKARARALRFQPDPLAAAAGWHPTIERGGYTLLLPPETAMAASVGTEPRDEDGDESEDGDEAALVAAVARLLADTGEARRLGYLDVTVNGMPSESGYERLRAAGLALANERLGVPFKLRVAPAAYHSTEQSEMDGPPDLVSIRLVARRQEECLLGQYAPAFLHAQAVSTWQAMIEAGRRCALLIAHGSLDDGVALLARCLERLARAGR